MSLSTNNAMTEYGDGPSRGRKQRGSVRVQEPAFGFFIAGSSMDEICGIFGRVNPNTARLTTSHPCHLCYKHDQSGYLMALVEIPPDELAAEKAKNRYSYEEPCGMEWVFITKTGKDLFRHKGDTIVPGAGTRWKHLHRTPETAASKAAARLKREKANAKAQKQAAKERDKELRRAARRAAKMEARRESRRDERREAIKEAKRTLRAMGGAYAEEYDSEEDDLDDYDDYEDEYEEYRMQAGLGDEESSDEESSSSEEEESSESEDEVEAAAEAMAARGAIVEVKDDNEDELPWQVIALLDESILRDLRWSNAYREKRVALALAGEDVDQPSASQSIEGFLMEEHRLALEHGLTSDVSKDTTGKPTFAAVHGWLYRVTAADGVYLYKKPKVCDKAAGARACGDLLRVVEVKGPWLRLAATEKGTREAVLTKGDNVIVVSGQYKGEKGVVAKDLDDKREIGVKLKGYTGTGTFHITECKREASSSAAERTPKRSPKRGGYGYAGGGYGESESESESEEEEDEEEDESDSEEDEGAVSGGGAVVVKEKGLWVCIDGPPLETQTKTRGKHDKMEDNASLPKRLVLLDTDSAILSKVKRTPLAPLVAVDGTGAEASIKSSAAAGDDDEWLIVERVEAELFDRPFEPRLEAEDADTETATAAATADGLANVESPEAEASAAKSASAALKVAAAAAEAAAGLLSKSAFASGADAVKASVAAAAAAAEAAKKATLAAAAGVPVGSTVELRGLTSVKFNGKRGVVLTPRNAEGRQGIRILPNASEGTTERAAEGDAAGAEPILVREANLVIVDGPTVAAKAGEAAGQDETAAEKSAAAVRAAAVLGVSLAAIGLDPSSARVSVADGRCFLDALLRAADRDHHHVQGAYGGAKAAVAEAKRAHRVLCRAITAKQGGKKGGGGDDDDDDDDGRLSRRAALAPHLAVEGGFLGRRAAAAAKEASASTSVTAINKGLASLAALLEEEQKRLVRHRGDWQASWGASVPGWRLEQAEGASASALMEEVADEQADDEASLFDGATGGCAEDCLLLRLAAVRVLLRVQREGDATAAAALTAKLHPHSAAAQLWLGRCLLRSGQRDAGHKALSTSVALAGGGTGMAGGAGAVWAHADGAARLRSLRRAKRAEVNAKDLYERGKFEEAAAAYTDVIAEYSNVATAASTASAAELGGGLRGLAGGVGGGDDKFGRAEALVARAGCLRRARQLKEAIADCDAALQVFPKYARALFRRALCLLESQRPAEAKATLEQLLRVDRQWPRLLDWLIRAAAQEKRAEAGKAKDEDYGAAEDDPEQASKKGGNEDYYAVLGVPTDATDAQLKRAYRLKSLKAHPDKPGGSASAFQLVATAYEVLADTEKRQLYDDGVDVKKKKKKKSDRDDESDSEDEDGQKKKSLREEVERKYFPENFKFWPFGDPFIEKRRHDTRKAKEAEEAKQRAANKGQQKQGGRKGWGWGADY